MRRFNNCFSEMNYMHTWHDSRPRLYSLIYYVVQRIAITPFTALPILWPSQTSGWGNRLITKGNSFGTIASYIPWNFLRILRATFVLYVSQNPDFVCNLFTDLDWDNITILSGDMQRHKRSAFRPGVRMQAEWHVRKASAWTSLPVSGR